jgi:LmbE family N-acetylglucosaminyl deacetylase
MKYFAIGAHPDDIEILCAGTLAKLKDAGHTIAMASLCNGDKGHFLIPSKELAEIRKKEAEASAALLGAEIHVGLFDDLGIYVDRPSVDKVVDLIRLVKPDVIITNAPNDYMMDHVNTSKIVVEASFVATLPNYKTSLPPHTSIVPIFFMDAVAGLNSQPTEYVDISDKMEIKEKMLLCHQSQYKWLKEHDGVDYVELMRSLSRYRGIQCGVEYAEGFTQYTVWGRIKPVRLLP